MTPTRASARASAASTSSIAWTHAVSETAASMRSLLAIGPKRASEGKEDSLPIALQADVEAEHATIVFGQQRPPPAGLDQAASGTIRVTRRLSRKIHTGHVVRELTAGEHGDIEVGRLQ